MHRLARDFITFVLILIAACLAYVLLRAGVHALAIHTGRHR